MMMESECYYDVGTYTENGIVWWYSEIWVREKVNSQSEGFD